MITLKQIAQKTGLNISTVSRALSDKSHLINKDTRQKIVSVAKKYGYVKNLNAEALAKGYSKDIGLLFPAIFESLFYNDFYLKVIEGISKVAPSYGYNLRILFLNDQEAFSKIVEKSNSWHLKGVVLSPFLSAFAEYHVMSDTNIKKINCPIVVLGKAINKSNIRSVVLDDFKGGYDGTQFLINLGHKKIAVIRGVLEDIEDRFRGYKKALADNGLKVNDSFILQGDKNAGVDTGYKNTKGLLNGTERPTAIFALDDEMAYGAIKAIKEEGLSCPGDISVLGFDGMRMDELFDPPLTTMERPVDLMAKKAIELLIDDEQWKSSDIFRLEARVLLRDSCRSIK